MKGNGVRDLKSGEVELWIRTETGMWLVLPDLNEYDLSKRIAASTVIEEIQSSIKEHVA